MCAATAASGTEKRHGNRPRHMLPRSQGGSNAGWFASGYDPRRHELTFAERSRGGRTSWRLFMISLRTNMNLPLPFWHEMEVYRSEHSD